MSINPQSRLRKTRLRIYGWKDGERFFTSLQPRQANAPRNEHANAGEAVAEASKRHLPIVWEKLEEIE